MSLHSMPLLLINMGGEMLYILQQRLKAQSISADKSAKVLEDVAATMYNPKFVDEMFKPQAIYTNQSVLQIFRRLAHSSIMRLNSNSMDKLYDLMAMVFKYQIMSCARPTDLMQITMNHLDSLSKIFPNSADMSDAASLLDRVRRLTLKLYSSMSISQFFSLRCTLLRFFLDRRIKVSLFLQGKLQDSNGHIFISHKGELPLGTDRPGLIRYLDNGKEIKSVVIDLPNSLDTTPSLTTSKIFNRHCPLGNNMYEVESSGDRRQGSWIGGASEKKEEEVEKEEEESNASQSSNKRLSVLAARGELNLLADLIHPSPSPKEYIKLSLFADDDVSTTPNSGVRSAEALRFKASDPDQTLKDVADAFTDSTEKNVVEDDGNDLLALMDN